MLCISGDVRGIALGTVCATVIDVCQKAFTKSALGYETGSHGDVCHETHRASNVDETTWNTTAKCIVSELHVVSTATWSAVVSVSQFEYQILWNTSRRLEGMNSVRIIVITH